MVKIDYEVNDNDLIVDEYGNYYEVLKWTKGTAKKEVTLVNAFMRYSFYMIMFFSRDIEDGINFKQKYDEKYTGQIAYDTLSQKIEFIKNNDNPKQGRLLKFRDLIENGYTIKNIPLYHR